MNLLRVLFFDENRMASRCLVLESDEISTGRDILIDLTVNADFGELPERELIGKTVSVNSLQPCEFIGVGVSIIEEGAAE